MAAFSTRCTPQSLLAAERAGRCPSKWCGIATANHLPTAGKLSPVPETIAWACSAACAAFETSCFLGTACPLDVVCNCTACVNLRDGAPLYIPSQPILAFPTPFRRAPAQNSPYQNKRVDSLNLSQANHDLAFRFRELGIGWRAIALDPYSSSRFRGADLRGKRAGGFDISPTSISQGSWNGPKAGSRGACAHEHPGGPPAARLGSPRE
jgi:hypothetical protein